MLDGHKGVIERRPPLSFLRGSEWLITKTTIVTLIKVFCCHDLNVLQNKNL